MDGMGLFDRNGKCRYLKISMPWILHDWFVFGAVIFYCLTVFLRTSDRSAPMPPFTTCISWPTLRSDPQNQKKTQKARKASKKVGDWGWGSCTHWNYDQCMVMYGICTVQGTNISHLRKRNINLQNVFKRGYVSSQEGIYMYTWFLW